MASFDQDTMGPAQQLELAAAAAATGSRTLWQGDLPPFADEAYVASLYQAEGIVAVKFIRDRHTGFSQGYAFLEFASHEAAADVLRRYSSQPIPGSQDCVFRLNWASHGVGRSVQEADHSVFVGDLAPEVTDLALQEAFRAFFPSVRSAKVITDPSTGRSRGYGFVRFGDGGERDAALARMQGHPLCDRPIRVSPATAKKGGEMMGGGGQQGGGNRGFGGFGGGPGGGQFGGFGGGGPGGYGNAMIGGNGYGGGGGGHPAPSDPNLATIFVGNLADAGDAELRAAFGHLGEVLYTKVPPGKGCGFVQFAARPSAEAAIASMQGALVGSQHVRVSWGRGPCAPPRAPPGALLPGGIGGPGGPPPPVSPGSFPAGNVGYGVMPPPQQQQPYGYFPGQQQGGEQQHYQQQQHYLQQHQMHQQQQPQQQQQQQQQHQAPPAPQQQEPAAEGGGKGDGAAAVPAAAAAEGGKDGGDKDGAAAAARKEGDAAKEGGASAARGYSEVAGMNQSYLRAAAPALLG